MNDLYEEHIPGFVAKEIYDHHIDAMKARERKPVMFWATSELDGALSQNDFVSMKWDQRCVVQNVRNADRLTAYKRKRAALGHEVYEVSYDPRGKSLHLKV